MMKKNNFLEDGHYCNNEKSALLSKKLFVFSVYIDIVVILLIVFSISQQYFYLNQNDLLIENYLVGSFSDNPICVEYRFYYRNV